MTNKIDKCHDCGLEIIIKDGDILNGYYLDYGKAKVFKCKECYKKSPELRNYQTCEVYSRVVGYLRPVQQWNEGKQAEFKSRKNYGHNTPTE